MPTNPALKGPFVLAALGLRPHPSVGHRLGPSSPRPACRTITPAFNTLRLTPQGLSDAQRLPALLCSALLVLTLTGCGKGNKTNPPDDKAGGPGDSPPQKTITEADLASAKPDATLTAEAWGKEFVANPTAAKAKYAGKVVEISGTVESAFEHGRPPRPVLCLDRTKDYTGVICPVADAWEKVAKGSVATVRGTVSLSNEPDVQPGELGTAILVKASPNPVKTFTAAELAKEFKTDWNALKTKLGGKQVYVEAEVLKNSLDQENNVVALTLKGDGEVNIVCELRHSTGMKERALKAGQKVKAFGYLSVEEKGLKLGSTLLKIY